MSRKTRIIGFLFFFLFLGLPLPSSMGAVPVITEVTVTDVTPVSFSVVFVVSEPSAIQVDVFESGCATPATSVSVASTSNAATGVSKATVTGLTAATTYCYQLTATSNSTSQSASVPPSPATVITETEVTRSYVSGSDLLPFGNDLIVHPVNAFDGTSGDGSILLVSIVSATGVNLGSFPVSASVGDGIISPDALADLNNLFGASTRMSLNLTGGERMKLLEIRGADGCTLDRWRKVPLDNNLVEVHAPGTCFDPADLDCNGSVNILDILRDVGGYNKASGDFCYNSDFDMNGTNNVNILDILYTVGKFGTHE